MEPSIELTLEWIEVLVIDIDEAPAAPSVEADPPATPSDDMAVVEVAAKLAVLAEIPSIAVPLIDPSARGVACGLNRSTCHTAPPVAPEERNDAEITGKTARVRL